MPLRQTIPAIVLSGLLLGVTSMPVLSARGDWPQFRGAASDGNVPAVLPLRWNAEENVLWKVESPGEGWSSPIIVQGKLLLTSAVMKQPPEGLRKSEAQPQPYRGGGGQRAELSSAVYDWEVRCLDAATGKTLWKRVAKSGSPPLPRHSSNTYATETPVSDGERVVAYFGMIGLFCYDLDGNLLWKKDLGNYKMRAGWGTSSSPVLWENLLFLQIDNDEQSFVTALDAKTGTERWRVERDEPSQYSSPIVWRNTQRAELVTGGQVCRSYDPRTGTLLWELDMAKGRSSATPVVDGDRLYVGTEFRNRGGADDGGGYLCAVKAGAQGRLSVEQASPHLAWSLPRSGIQMASPVVCQGHIYLLERRSGMVYCVDAQTGKLAYQKRIPGARAFWASPWTDGQRVFALDDTGTTHVLAGGPEFKVLAANSLPGQFWATASASDKRLYLRSTEALYCIAK